MNTETLATELIHSQKSTIKWLIVVIIVITTLWAATVGGFIWYVSLPVEEYNEVYNEDGNANYIGNDMSGVINNGESKSRGIWRIKG